MWKNCGEREREKGSDLIHVQTSIKNNVIAQQLNKYAAPTSIRFFFERQYCVLAAGTCPGSGHWTVNKS